MPTPTPHPPGHACAGWLAVHGPLTRGNVLEYVSVSPYYTADCINERVRQGSLDPAQLRLASGVQYVLKGVVQGPATTVPPPPSEGGGTASEDSHVVDRIFVIHRLYRREGLRDEDVMGLMDVRGDDTSAADGPVVVDGCELLSAYYILDGTIFQCPDLATLLTARVERVAHLLSLAVAELQPMRPAMAVARVAATGGGGSVPVRAARGVDVPPDHPIAAVGIADIVSHLARAPPLTLAPV